MTLCNEQQKRGSVPHKFSYFCTEPLRGRQRQLLGALTVQVNYTIKP